MYVDEEHSIRSIQRTIKKLRGRIEVKFDAEED